MIALLAALFFAPALAQEGIALDPPQAVRGDPRPALALAWDLPPQRPEYLAEEVEELRCALSLAVDAEGGVLPTVVSCPEPMATEALVAAGRWRFAPDPAPTTVSLVYVLRYSAALGAMTLHAELDPGADAALSEGRPGLRLVHEASPLRPLSYAIPGKARKAGQGPADCALRVRVGASGRVLDILAVACPPPLLADANKRLLKERFAPTRVDGQAQEDVIDLVLRYAD